MSRAVMQQALEALESDPVTHAGLVDRKQAITALRAALAEPEQEPVAWQWLDTANYRKKLPADAIPEHWRPLFTAPTPRKPLTEDEIVDIWAGVSMGYDDEINIIELARAIERAHGIGEQHE